jgi:oligopeptide transport system ATP-binding protein
MSDGGTVQQPPDRARPAGLIEPMQAQTLLTVKALTVRFPVRRRQLGESRKLVHAVEDVSFSIERAHTLGIVGESGCGKSTTARAVAMLTRPSSGMVQLDGIDLARLSRHALRHARRRLQIVFQDPYSSLDPRMQVGAAIAEPLLIHRMASGADAAARARQLLTNVGLNEADADRYPHEFSGGERQRVAIARALAVRPELLICDEPVSSLDVSVQAQIINLLRSLQDRLQLAVLFIAHDLAVVRHVSSRIAVMYLGRIVEIGDRDAICSRPLHPYTQSLMSAIPEPDPRQERRRQRIVLQGDVPSPISPPSGCHFHTRCPYVRDRCRIERPPLISATAGHEVACHFWNELTAKPAGQLHLSGPAETQPIREETNEDVPSADDSR